MIKIGGKEAVLSILIPQSGNHKLFSLYFHIPFCTRKCDYCHFYVIPDRENHKDLYINSLKKEWQMRSSHLKDGKLVSIYFGGGTPSLLDPKHLEKILSWTKPWCTLNTEITMEANPENISRDRIKAFSNIGINRLSIGIQAFDNILLKILGRTHTAEKAIEAVEKSVDFIKNISIDLMYDLPKQTLRIWEKTIDQALLLPVKHLSIYNLTI